MGLLLHPSLTGFRWGGGGTRGGGVAVAFWQFTLAQACLDTSDAADVVVDADADGRREVLFFYMMTHGARLLVIFCTGFPSYALCTAFMISSS